MSVTCVESPAAALLARADAAFAAAMQAIEAGADSGTVAALMAEAEALNDLYQLADPAGDALLDGSDL